MFSRFTATQKGLILIAVPVLFELVFFAYLFGAVAEARKKADDLRSSKNVFLRLYHIQYDLARGVLFFSNPKTQEASVLLPKISKLKRKLSRGTNWTELQVLDPAVRGIIKESDQTRLTMVSLIDRASQVVADNSIPVQSRFSFVPRLTLVSLVCQVQDMAKEIVRLQRRFDSEPEEITKFHRHIVATVACGLLLSFALSLALVKLFTTDVVNRLKTISFNILRASSGKPLAPLQKGGDEIAKLDELVHDMTEKLVEIRKKELAILDNAADVICSLDQRLRFTALSASVEKVWKLSQSDLVGTNLKSLIDDKSSTFDTPYHLEKIASSSQDGQFENTIRCGDGTHRHFRWSVRFSSQDKTYYCVAHDITERRAIEQLKQQFLSIVSHDLRAPLSATAISIKMLTSGKSGELSEKVKKILSRIESSLDRLTELVNELLELDKLEAGQMNLKIDVTSAFEVCEAAKNSLEGAAEKRNVTLAAVNGDALILADEAKLIQAVCNLLSNAIKFSPAGARVYSTIEKIAGRVIIKIKDEGPGIPPADAAIIFDKFAQSRSAKLASEKSTGLGLAIVKALVEAHEGKVGVESKEGAGSTFFIELAEYRGDIKPGEESL